MNKNNKGFSLVELIVVILIMAILGVALTPQVMKWVNNSRTSSDVQTYEALISAAQLTLGNETQFAAVKAATGTSGNVLLVSLNQGNTQMTITAVNDAADHAVATSFFTKFKENFPDWDKAFAKTGTSAYTFYVTDKGTITRGNAPALADSDK